MLFLLSFECCGKLFFGGRFVLHEISLRLKSGEHFVLRIINGSYFRLKNISIGYNLKKEWLKNLGIDKLRLYATGSNLLTFTGYSGLDPDFINTNIWNSGTDSFSYPNTRSVMFGLDLTF